MAKKAQQDEQKQPGKGIYLLPNLFTTAGLFAGFYAVVSALKGVFDTAASVIFIAMIADYLDGRVARMTGTQSPFGAQYDSLSDMVAFGVAPSLVMYSWSLSSLGKMGWLAAFTYTAAAALRLARFNTQVATADKRYFQGLPCPTAAGVLASFVWLGHKYNLSGVVISNFVAVLTVAIAALMVSNIRYHSFKEIDFKGRVSFVTVLMVVVIFVGIALNPPVVLFSVFFLYAAAGPVLTLWSLRKAKKAKKKGK